MVKLGDQTQWHEKGLEYLRYQYDLKPEDFVLDIGSYRREFADRIKKEYGSAVYCFEALDDSAAWKYDGVLKMGGQFYYTSAFDPNNQREFKCVDIAPFIEMADIALCKINIEGMEYELLEYIIEKNLLRNIKNLQVQFHLIDGEDCESRYAALAEQLKKTHSLTWRYDFVWENWRRK